jgi:DNA-binding transcriptional MerR regulator
VRYRTGAFARVAGVTVRTVRYYDQIGLLRPAEVDPGSGYRVYLPSQVHELRRILDLKALDFTLDEIKSVLGGELFDRDLRALLEAKRLEAQHSVRDAQDRLGRIDAWLGELLDGAEPAAR